MSWVDQQRGALAEEPVRRAYYFSSTTSSTTFSVADQLPQQIPLRVQAIASWASNLFLSDVQNTYSKIAELRLYDAFSTERTLNVRNDAGTITANAQPFLLLGHFYVNGSNSTPASTVSSWNFIPASSFETRSMNSGQWRFLLWDPKTNAVYPDSATRALSVAVDIRRGGKLTYTD